jgi:hypothetical protein
MKSQASEASQAESLQSQNGLRWKFESTVKPLEFFTDGFVGRPNSNHQECVHHRVHANFS